MNDTEGVAGSGGDGVMHVDEIEYREAILGRQRDPSEGDIVCDIDLCVDSNASYPIEQSSVAMSPSSTGRRIDRGNTREKEKKEKTVPIPSIPTNAIPWPKSVEGLCVGRRVDAADHRGHWLAGSIVDRWLVTPNDLSDILAAEKMLRREKAEREREAGGKGKSSLASFLPSGGAPKVTGWHVRVHFDDFTGK